MDYQTIDTRNVMHALGASNMTIGNVSDCEVLRTEDLTKKNSATRVAAGKSHEDVCLTGRKKEKKKKITASSTLKSDNLQCRRKSDGVSDPSDSSWSSVELKKDQGLLNELLELADQLLTDVYELRADYEGRRLRKSSVGTFAYTDDDMETIDNELRNLEFGLQRLQLRATASGANMDDALRLLSAFKNFRNDYELVKTIHENAKTRARLERRLRKRRLDEKELFGCDTGVKTGSWIAYKMCWPCRVLYRLFVGNPVLQK